MLKIPLKNSQNLLGNPTENSKFPCTGSGLIPTNIPTFRQSTQLTSSIVHLFTYFSLVCRIRSHLGFRSLSMMPRYRRSDPLLFGKLVPWEAVIAARKLSMFSTNVTLSADRSNWSLCFSDSKLNGSAVSATSTTKVFWWWHIGNPKHWLLWHRWSDVLSIRWIVS